MSSARWPPWPRADLLTWLRDGLVAARRGLAVALLSQLGAVPLLVLSVVSLGLLPLGVGFITLPIALFAVRGLADLHRRFLGSWCGVAIPSPYRPREGDEFELLDVPSSVRYCRLLLTDRSTWRDLLWLLVDVPVGLLLGLLPCWLMIYGIHGVVATPLFWPLMDPGYGYGLIWPVDSTTAALLSFFQGTVILLLGFWSAERLLRAHSRITRRLLSPTAEAYLSRRVAELTETRSAAVDAQAAELRRIERDLHDGAQARLVAIGLKLGLASQMFRKDPDTAYRLLADARAASAQALAELRDLVRGIHPPVLAERGLDGAVRALALDLPIPVQVDIDLPGRPEPPVESAGYFAVAEVLANVAKHSAAGSAWIRLGYADGRLRLVVGDDGGGGAKVREGGGLDGLRRRLAPFDGTLDLHSPVGGPTTVTMELPCVL
ncbi:sensor domain-containing protein [Streptomyces sp. BE20]|uniref:sensor histidine kinase n=1 Tax=Streptomycetaceae TaxID=2062 RepID=UPI002E78532F|nr:MULTISPECIES: sensor domain-containing protein [unclassified Streptomyces]MED7948580.1 sensor domain-containing protein [Streptomyces sp. BE303]MEE1823493.1 sensor domain-containing protein [Streptomyces sp. BE20]